MKLVMEMRDEALKIVVGGKGDDESTVLLTISALTEEGVIAVKNACIL